MNLPDLSAELKRMALQVKNLPRDLPEGLPEGPIATFFSERELRAGDEDDGPYKVVNRAYDTVFQQKTAAELSKLVTGGQYGMPMMLDYFQFWAEYPGMDKGLLALRVSQVNDLISKTTAFRNVSTSNASQVAGKKTAVTATTKKGTVDSFVSAKPATSAATKTKKTSATATAPSNSRQAKAGEKRTRKDRDYVPPKSDAEETDEEVSASEKDLEESDGGEAVRSKKKVKKAGNPEPAESVKGPDSGEQAEDGIEKLSAKPGRAPKKSQWAISQYTPHAMMSKTSKPIWKWACKWCSQFRTSPRTKGVKDYAKETLELKITSNFTSHFDSCTGLPKNKNFDAFVKAEEDAKSRGDNPAPQQSAFAGSQPLDGDEDGGCGTMEKTRLVLSKFIANGQKNPAVEVTQKGFRELFLRAVIEDDLPFLFGEKPGVSRLLIYLLPSHYKIPKRKTVRRDLDTLYEKLSNELNNELQTLDSKIAVASDLWTSKNSVYAFAGLIGFWITSDWQLVECVFELLPLDGDHSGQATGQLMFQSMRRRKIVEKLSANTSDNASSNGEVNKTLSKCIFATNTINISSSNMEIGCAGHVVNLIAQEILHVLGLMPDPEEVDLYEDTRQFDLTYSARADIDAADADAQEAEREVIAIDGSDSESEKELELDQLSSDSDEAGIEDEEAWIKDPKPVKAPKVKRQDTIVDKLHEIVTDIVNSEVRRKRFKVIVQATCEPEYHNLVPVRGMRIRWNTTLEEVRRGVKLRPALNRWNDERARGLTGKKKEAAEKKAKDLHLSPTDWDNLAQLVKFLSILEQATLDLSRKAFPTICQVLVIYKTIESEFAEKKVELPFEISPTFPLENAIDAGLRKLDKYIKKSLESDYPLLGTILHPAFRLSYFEKDVTWDSRIAVRGRVLLDHLFEVYRSERGHLSRKPVSAISAKPVSAAGGMFQKAAMRAAPVVKKSSKEETEVDVYLSGVYPSKDEYPLTWYQKHCGEFPILSAIARDVLAIPGVSIPVERLFSSSKHTMSDQRSKMNATTAAKAVVLKEWLKAGLGKDVSYLQGM